MSRRPWFLIQSGGGWQNRHMYTWRGFCQKNKAISLTATAAGCLATVLLEESTPFFPWQHAVCTRWLARQGQLSISASAGSVARQGILGQYSQNFICLWRRCTSLGFLVIPQVMVGHPKHSALSWQSVFSLSGQQVGAGYHRALGKIPALCLMYSHPPYTWQKIFEICRISLILCIFISLKLSLVTRSMTHTNISHALRCL